MSNYGLPAYCILSTGHMNKPSTKFTWIKVAALYSFPCINLLRVEKPRMLDCMITAAKNSCEYARLESQLRTYFCSIRAAASSRFTMYIFRARDPATIKLSRVKLKENKVCRRIIALLEPGAQPNSSHVNLQCRGLQFEFPQPISKIELWELHSYFKDQKVLQIIDKINQ